MYTFYNWAYFLIVFVKTEYAYIHIAFMWTKYAYIHIAFMRTEYAYGMADKCHRADNL